MKKNLITTLLITIPVLISSLVYAQNVNISFSPTDSSGHLICKTTTTIMVDISEPVNSVVAYYKKRGDTTYQSIGTTTTYTYTGYYRYSIEWNISNLTNKEYYDVQIEVKSGNSTSFFYTWVQVDRNPRVEVQEVKYSTSPTGVLQNLVFYNDYYYLRNGYLQVKLRFKDCTGSLVTMSTTTSHPTVKLKIGEGLPFNTTYYWDSNNTWIGMAEIKSDVPNGYATLEITGAKSSDNYTMEPFSKEMFIIDTVQPTVVEVKVDEDEDGNFTNNNGYLNLEEQGRVYVWFSEYLTPEPTASFTINGKEYGLREITWENTKSVNSQTYGNYGFFKLPEINNLMGEGEATIKIHPYPTSKDFAGNYLKEYTLKYKVDAIPPSPPIITSPTNSTTVPKGVPIKVAINDPDPKEDVKYVRFVNDNGESVFDFNKPYEVYLPAASPITVEIYDKADNYSQTSISFLTTPEIDKIPPKAKIIYVTDSLVSNLTANVNDSDSSIAEVKFQYSVDKTSWTDIYTDYTSPWQATWDARDLKDGIYYLRAVAKDINNNIDPNPTITTVEKHPYGVRIEQDSADFDPPAKISAKINLDNKRQPKEVVIKVNSRQKPYINVNILDSNNNFIDAKPSTELLVEGTSGNFTTTVPLDVIKSKGGRVYVHAFVVDENNCVYRDYTWAIANTVDPQEDFYYGNIIKILKDTLTSKNTLILEKTYDVPPANEGLVILQAYNLSWTNPVNRFNKDVTIKFSYTTVNGLYQYSTADYQKFTICTWDGKKWITDKDMSELTRTASYTRVNTKHSSYFALVADYSKPKIEKFDIVGRTFFGKVTDTGSGICGSSITVTVNGSTYTASSNGKYDPETGDFYITTDPNLSEGVVYPYTFVVEDQAGNKTIKTGSFRYTKEFMMKDVHNYPNPFDPDKEVTNIQIPIGEYLGTVYTSITIFDFNGEVIYKKEDSLYITPGVLNLLWDGRDNNGNKVANGVYFCRIEVGNYKSDYFKIAVLRKK